MAWKLARLAELRPVPPLVVWLTEQLPNPEVSPSLVGGAARARYQIERAARSRALPRRLRESGRVQRRLIRAGRLRALGELLEARRLGLLGLVAAFSRTHVEILEGQGLPAAEIPFGGAAHLGQRLGIRKSIDVLFLGNARRSRRAEILAALVPALAGRGIELALHTGRPDRAYVAGVERSVLVNRSRILLGLGRQPWDDPIYRYLLAASNDALFVTEPLRPSSRGPLVPGRHHVEAESLAALPETLERWIARTDDRHAIVEEARAQVSGELSMASMAIRLLETLGERGLIRNPRARADRP